MGKLSELVIYRIEHKDKGNGMWYNINGEHEPFIETLTEGKSKSLPMEHDEEKYRKDNLKWFCGCQSLELLNQWFSIKDIEELLSANYGLYEITVEQYILEDTQILFTQEGIINKVEIGLNSI